MKYVVIRNLRINSYYRS